MSVRIPKKHVQKHNTIKFSHKKRTNDKGQMNHTKKKREKKKGKEKNEKEVETLRPAWH